MSQFDNSSCYNRGRRTNHRQKQILIAAMAMNRHILERRTGDSAARRMREAVWKKIMLELNNAGPEKNINEWRKVWTDLRLGMRKKWEKAQTSNYILSEYERRVIYACGMVEQSEPGYGYGYSDGKSAEDINSFLAFLKEELIKEHEPILEYSQYLKEENSNAISNYLTDSSEFIICEPEPEDTKIKDEFCEESMEYQEPSVECISDDDEPTTKIEEFRESSVECISDDDDKEPMITNDIKLESPLQLSYEEPILIETSTRTIPPEAETVQQLRPENLQMPSIPVNNKNVSKKRKLKYATLKEVRKMHRNLLKESKKQTTLLRKIVEGMKT